MKDILQLRNIRLLLLCAVVVLTAGNVDAQVFPVQANLQLTGPYSPYLTDYTAPGAQKLFLQLRPNDITISDHPIKLRFTLEGVGITIRTKPSFIPSQPLMLNGGGIPTLFYGEDVAEYFNPNNLDFSGISRKEFERSSKLPEGVYRVSVEVFSFNRDVPISNRAMTMAWIILNDPPLLNLPRKDLKVRIIDPTNIAFTWTPRHTGSPNSAFTTEYTFRLVEIWPANRNPYDAFLSQPALYETVTNQTQIIYGPAEPALIPGRKYAWQVQATDVEGRDLFKNQGRSEVYVFQFGDEISPPENVRQDNANATAMNISWEPPAQGEMPLQYHVRYRRKGGDGNGTWYEAVTTQRWATLPNLQPGVSYDVQVRSEASPQLSEYSVIRSFKTAEETLVPYVCGQQTVFPPLMGSLPLPVLRPGDVITSRNFKVHITEAKGANGAFTGKGIMAVPFLNMASVNVVFNGVSLNDRYELVSGEIVTVYNRGSEIARQVKEAQDIGETKNPPPAPYDSTSIGPVVTINIKGEIDSVYFDPEKREIVLVDAEGNKNTYAQPLNETKEPVAAQVVDAAGNTYVVDKDGKVTNAGSSLAQGGNPTPGVTDPVKDRIIVLLLAQFEEEIGAWLRANGKGGEEDQDITLAASLPDAFPEEADILSHLKSETIPYYKEQSTSIVKKIETSPDNKTLFDRVAKSFSDAKSVDLAKIGQEDQEILREFSAEALIDLDENLAYEGSTPVEAFVRGENLKYILCFTPAGALYALPDGAKTNFTITTNIGVPPGALTTFELDGDNFYAYYLKQEGTWQFKGYFTKTRNGKYSHSGPRMSFMTEDAIEEALEAASTQVNTEPTLASSVVIGIALAPHIVERIGIQAGEILAKSTGSVLVKLSAIASRANVISLIISTVASTFMVYSDSYYGAGPVALELPLTAQAVARDENYESNPPTTIPVAIPHATENKKGYCHVYVIWGIGVSGPFVAKYGMTCREDYANKGECNPRPDLQCNKFRRENTDPTILDYRYSWVIRNVDRSVAFIVERSMTAGYVIVNKGKLPPKHYLPCFVREDDFDERVDRASEWLKEQLNKFGK